VLKSPRTPVSNIIKTENADENIENQSSILNDSDVVNKNNFQAKERSSETMKKVIKLLLSIRFRLVI